MIRRALITVAVSVMCGVPLLAFAAAPANAHAGFVSSDPAGGASLASPPEAITITFTEPPDAAISQVTVVDAAGAEVEVGPLERSGRALVAPFAGELAEGVYTVNWVAVSTVDGHFTTGTFAFGVGAAGEVPTNGGAASSPDPTPVGVIGRAALYVGIALVIACAVVGGWAFGLGPRSLRAIVVAGGILGLAGALLLLASEVDLIGTSTRTFLRSETGSSFVQLLVAATITAGLTVLAAARPHGVTLGLAGTAAVSTAVARAAAGHADGVVQELLQAVHIAAVGVWIGGLALLALLLRERRDDPPAAEARRFSSLALVAVVIVIVTGAIRAVQEADGIGGLADAIDTGYGQVLAIKVGLALVLVALGAVNRRRSIPRIEAGDPSPLGRIVRAEVVLALGVALLTGALTSLPPGGADRSAPPAPPSVTAEGSDFGTTTTVTLRVSPGSPGPNRFVADVRDYDSHAPLAADAVTLRFARAGAGAGAPSASVDLSRDGDRWTAEGSALSIAGTWNVTAQVRTGDDTVDVPLVITTAAPGATTSVAEVAGAPPITTITYRDGRSAQLYVDPGVPGPNQVHVTTFDAAGQELQLERASLAVVPPSGPAATADVLRFGPGHFVANLELEGGAWIFDFNAVPVEGAPMQATLRTTIGATP